MKPTVKVYQFHARAMCRQLIHLHDPLSVGTSPVITLAFWSDVDDIDSSEQQPSRSGNAILDCVPLDGGVVSSWEGKGEHAGTISTTDGRQLFTYLAPQDAALLQII